MMLGSVTLAFLAGSSAFFGLWSLITSPRVLQLQSKLGSMSAALKRTRHEGHQPTRAEYWQFSLLAAAGLAGVGSIVGGFLTAVLFGLAAPVLIQIGVQVHRARYRSGLHRGAPLLARALADALAGGYSVSGAITQNALSLPGAIGKETATAARELAMGRPIDLVLTALQRRAGSQSINTLVTAIMVQSRFGGDLVGLLRELAAAFENAERVGRDARAATTQARLSAWIVFALPLLAAISVEMLNGGFFATLVSNPISIMLVLVSLLLQIAAFIALRRVTATCRV